jgi:hypothetical protein
MSDVKRMALVWQKFSPGASMVHGMVHGDCGARPARSLGFRLCRLGRWQRLRHAGTEVVNNIGNLFVRYFKEPELVQSGFLRLVCLAFHQAGAAAKIAELPKQRSTRMQRSGATQSDRQRWPCRLLSGALPLLTLCANGV